ncbi:MAG: diphthine synthase, partial [Candidatus Woesearchaeota archaeon]
RSSDIIYLENYTSALINCPVEKLEKLYGKKILIAERELVEQSDRIVEEASKVNVALLIIGDPLTATTHLDIMMRAKKIGIPVKVVHNASILSAVAITGLQPYKFGKTVTIPFPEINFKPEIFYEVLRQNKILGLHTLLLLDLKPKEKRFMTVKEAIDILLEIDSRRKQEVFEENTLCIGIARVGSDDQKIVSGAAKDVRAEDFGKAPFSLIVPGELHFMEEEFLAQYRSPTEKRA